MTESSPRFGLPFIVAGQAQKEIYHNEALGLIDAVLHPAVESLSASAPPASPLPGQCWVVATGASGLWSGRDGQIALWTDGGWRFLAPRAGLLVWDKADASFTCFDGIGWSAGQLPVDGIRVAGEQVIGARQPPVSSPSGGTIIDAEARLAIGQITAALMSHGLIG